jgi:hypothetical protein
MLLLETNLSGNMSGTKHCAKCDRNRSTNLFYKRAQSKDGLSSYCIDCWKALNEKRKEEMYAQQAEYRDEHRDERRKTYRKYWKENAEEIKARRRARYAELKKEAAKAAQNKKKTSKKP